MLLIRRFEEKAAEAYVAGKIISVICILARSVAVGAISAIRQDDYVLASYPNTDTQLQRDDLESHHGRVVWQSDWLFER